MNRLPNTSRRIGSGRERSRGSGRSCARLVFEHENPVAPEARRKPGVERDRAGVLEHDRGAAEQPTRCERFALEDGGLDPADAGKPDPLAAQRGRLAHRRLRVAREIQPRGFERRSGSGTHPHPRRRDFDRSTGARVTEMVPMLSGKRGRVVAILGCGHRERRLGAAIPEIQQVLDPHPPVGEALRGERSHAFALEFLQLPANRVRRLAPGGQRDATRVALTVPTGIRNANPIRGENARQRVEEHRSDSEFSRNRADVLAGRATETHERAVARVDAARDRYFGDRAGHARVRDLDEARGHAVAVEIETLRVQPRPRAHRAPAPRVRGPAGTESDRVARDRAQSCSRSAPARSRAPTRCVGARP